MILHVALFSWNDAVGPDDVDRLTADLRSMADRIDSIVSYACGPNLGITPSTADFMVAAAVTDAAGLTTYLGHPLHRAVQERWLDRMVASRTAAQLPMPFPVADE